MVRVNLRFVGEMWRAFALPVTPQVAHTLTKAAEQLGLADEIHVKTKTEDGPSVDIRT